MNVETKSTIRVAVRFFASLREAAGQSEGSIELAAGSTAGEVWEACARRWPGLAVRRQSTALAVNREFARPGTPVGDGDEVAFLPPVSGGR
jgi:molybdopterin converting factor subunit 1